MHPKTQMSPTPSLSLSLKDKQIKGLSLFGGKEMIMFVWRERKGKTARERICMEERI